MRRAEVGKKLTMALGAIACCGLAMAAALGVLALGPSLVIVGPAVLVGFLCVGVMVMAGHRHRAHGDSRRRHAADDPRS